MREIKQLKADWLKNEIAKLESEIEHCTKCQKGHVPLGMNDDGEVEWGGCDVCVIDGVYCEDIAYREKNDILTSIITRYKEELKVLESK